MKSYKPSVGARILTVLALLGLILSLFAFLGVLGIASSYFPENNAQYTVVLVIGIVVFLGLATALIRRFAGRIPTKLDIGAILIPGIALSLFGLYALITDFGDWLIYIFPFLTGLALLVVGTAMMRRTQGAL